MITGLLDEGMNPIEIVLAVFGLGVMGMIGNIMSSTATVTNPFEFTAEFFGQAGAELSSMFF